MSSGMRHENKKNTGAIKLYETTSKKMLTFALPRFYKQTKTTEQRSEKVTAPSVRKAAGKQGSWFKKESKIKKWHWQFLLDHGMLACD